MRIIAEIDGWHKEIVVVGAHAVECHSTGRIAVGIMPPLQECIDKKDLIINDYPHIQTAHCVELRFNRFDEWGTPVFTYR